MRAGAVRYLIGQTEKGRIEAGRLAEVAQHNVGMGAGRIAQIPGAQDPALKLQSDLTVSVARPVAAGNGDPIAA
jgi:hypothetical protein